MDGLMQYLLARRQKVDYARFRAMGWKIGSGTTESSCKSHARDSRAWACDGPPPTPRR